LIELYYGEYIDKATIFIGLRNSMFLIIRCLDEVRKPVSLSPHLAYEPAPVAKHPTIMFICDPSKNLTIPRCPDKTDAMQHFYEASDTTPGIGDMAELV
jgi:hypothetical protein